MRYLVQFFVILVVFLVTCSAINWLVDPYGLYWSPHIKGFNDIKIESSERGRQTKYYRVTQVEPEILIVGNSRVEMGFQHTNSYFEGKRIYNYASPGISLETQFNRLYTQIQENGHLKTVYLSLDFLDFLYISPGGKPDKLKFVDEALKPINFILSLNTLVDSIYTITNQSKLKNHLDFWGTNIADSYLAILKSEGKRPLFSQKLAEIKSRLNKGELAISGANNVNKGIVLLQELINLTHAKSIELKLFINPYHYSYLHQLEEVHYFEQYLRWKTLLATIELPDGFTPIIDFSGFNLYTLDLVALEKPHQAMQWFWEPAHYKAKLGDKILDALNSPTNKIAFGRPITHATIANIINNDMDGLKQSHQQWLELKEKLTR